MLFSFCVFWCFDIWILADPGGNASARASLFLEILNSFPLSVTLMYKPTSLEPTLPPSLNSSILDHYLPALITQQSGTRQPGTAPLPQSSPRLFNYSILNLLTLLTLPCLSLPTETTIKVLIHVFPILSAPWLILVLPCVAPHVVCHAFCF